ncbi:hypothetical protein AB0F25_38975 [Streptomyces wedmorensis]|uniref:hypothetical protein n=1 Tax=Streptomyces wedmorensis TaxID=43759 RepID=UPI003428A837
MPLAPLPIRDRPKNGARTFLVTGPSLPARALIGTVIGMFLFARPPLLLVIASFVDHDNRPGPRFSAITPAVAADFTLFARAPPGSRSGPFPDQPPPRSLTDRCLPWSRQVQPLYHQQTKNLLVSYSPKKLGFF